MEKKEPFGSQYAETFDVGDIVAWSTWCSNSNSYIDHTGILISIISSSTKAICPLEAVIVTV